MTNDKTFNVSGPVAAVEARPKTPAAKAAEAEAAKPDLSAYSAVELLTEVVGRLESSRSTVYGESYRYIAEQLRFFADKLSQKGAI